jgi:hypothetical protein
MKNVILFVAVLMLVKPLWPLAEYVVNYDYIIENLCENKDKPQMNCDGKCYLAKQLAKESEDKEKNPFDGEKSNTEIQHVVFFQNLSPFDLETCINDSGYTNFGTTQFLTSSLFVTDISQPPEWV